MVSLNNYSIFIQSDTKSHRHFRTARHEALLNTHVGRRQHSTLLSDAEKTPTRESHPYFYSGQPKTTENSPVRDQRVPLCENNDYINVYSRTQSKQTTRQLDSPYLESPDCVKLVKHQSSPTKTQQSLDSF